MSFSRWTVAAAVWALVAGGFCTGAAAQGEDSEPALIPRRALFAHPQRTRPQLSPDGSRLAFLAPVDGAMQVWVAPTDDLAAAKPVTTAPPPGVRLYEWAYTNEHILHVQDVSGDERFHVYATAVPVDGPPGEALDLTPLPGVSARIVKRSARKPSVIVVAINSRDPAHHDLYRIDITTGERELLQRNTEGFAAFVVDDDLTVRFAVRFDAQGGQEVLRPGEDGGWTVFMQTPPEDALTTSPIGFSKDGSLLYMYDSRGRDTIAVTATDVRTGHSAVIIDFAGADVEKALVHPTEGRVQAAAHNRLRRRWAALDPSIAADLQTLQAIAEGDVDIVSRSLDDSLWLVSHNDDDHPLRYSLYDRRTKQATLLFWTQPDLVRWRLARTHPVEIPSRDGFTLVGYLTLPPHLDSSSVGAVHAVRPLPLVLTVHGGPWARDRWGFNRLHQWLANRGYAALSVNFRGSTGFGKRFVNAGDREWGGKMQDDLVDAVRWAVKQGVADPERVCIFGASYGGYAALMGLARDPEVFACGVDMFGPSNLLTLLRSVPPYWSSILDLFRKRVGDFTTKEGQAFLLERSPVSHVDRIRAPLLVAQGANDPRVPQAESDRMVEALKARGLPVVYALFPDEGHGFAREENRLAFFALAEAFLARQLGGRVEPAGEDIKGSSMVLKAGDAALWSDADRSP
ncbi:MAG: S9 family peptidase [Planctomycetota bacterium]|nr:MAG: S9 family peptidase [Planctomycetota bacterium]